MIPNPLLGGDVVDTPEELNEPSQAVIDFQDCVRTHESPPYCMPQNAATIACEAKLYHDELGNEIPVPGGAYSVIIGYYCI